MATKPLRLDSPKARLALKKRPAPYWLAVTPGLALGYRRGIRGGHWLIRMQDKEMRPCRRQEALGVADDLAETGGVVADGIKILDYEQARTRALARFQGVPADHWTNPVKLKSILKVSDAVNNYLGWLEHRGKSWKATKQMATCHILGNQIGEVPMVDLTKGQIASWHLKIAESQKMTNSGSLKSGGQQIPLGETEKLKNARKARRSTANRVLTILKAALTHQQGLQKKPITIDEPWRRVYKFPEAGVKRDRELSIEEQRKLIIACGPGLKELVQGALLTGARYSELANLRVSKVLLKTHSLSLPETKGGGPASIPLSKDACAFLEIQIKGRKPNDRVFLKADGTPWGQNHHAKPFREAVVAAGIEPVIFHELRHAFAISLLKAGMDPVLVSRALGHKSTRMIEEHYGHLLHEWVASAFQKKAPRVWYMKPSPVIRK